jgi:uncharacterized membrane protein
MAEKPASRRWIGWALVASLGLNLAVVGLAAGAFLHGPPAPPSLEVRWIHVRALPAPYRRDLIKTMRAERRDWQARREALRDRRETLAAALRAEPYQAEAVSDAMFREREAADAAAERGMALLLEQIDRMTPEERDAYAEALLQDRRPGRPGKPGRPRD